MSCLGSWIGPLVLRDRAALMVRLEMKKRGAGICLVGRCTDRLLTASSSFSSSFPSELYGGKGRAM
jgi:hypothetical protein